MSNTELVSADEVDEMPDAVSDEDAIANDEDAEETMDVATETSKPKEAGERKVRTGPTGQMLELAKTDPTWLSADLATQAVATLVQIGKAIKTTAIHPVIRDVVKEIADAQTGEVKKVTEKETTNEEVATITYEWGEPTIYGDLHKALTPALRLQANVAKAKRADGYSVKEVLSKEFGVWYATHADESKPGFRFSVGLAPRPAEWAVTPKPPKEPKAPREPKAKKEKPAPELDAEGNPIPPTKAAKAPRKKADSTKAAIAAVPAVDDTPVEVSDEE